MPLDNDVCMDTQDIINLLIDGYDNPAILGLKDRIDLLFPEKNVYVISRHPSARLPNETELTIPLRQPVFCVYDLDADTDRLFHRNQLPNQSPSGSPSATTGYGWIKEWTIQMDVFGRTLPETRDIADAVEKDLVDFFVQIWDNLRVGMYLMMPFYGLTTVGELEAYHKYGRIRARSFQKKE